MVRPDDKESSGPAPIMGELWSPLAAVTSQWGGKANGQIAVAIGAASIVPERPRVIVQIYKGNLSHHLIYNSGAFALNFLHPGQTHLIKELGLSSGRDREKLVGIAYDIGDSGSPILRDCWGYLDCRVVNAMDGGDLTCFLAEVVDGQVRHQGGPIRWRDARRQLPLDWLAEWERKQAAEIEFSRRYMGEIDYSPWKTRERREGETP